jgi:predicted aldo/keto reductase-like oxidoreductase
LKTVSAVAVGGAVGPWFGRAAAEPLTVNGLPAAALGRTGLKVTKISFGGVLATEPPLLLRVIDQGINFIHTSPGYQNGRSIRTFGEVLQKSSQRDKVVLALKATPDELDNCLRQLKTDYVDILVPPLTSMGAIADPRLPESFQKVKQAGKAGFLGWAGHSNTTEIFNRGRELGYFDVTLMSYANISDPSFLEAAKAAAEAGMGIFTMKGLPKRNATGATPAEAATFSSLCSSMVNRQHAHSVLASMGSFQSVDFYRGILENKLTDYNRTLEERYLADQMGNYCAMCGTCEGTCPEAADVPRILRYRMYRIDYGLADYAQTKYARLGNRPAALSGKMLEVCEGVCPRKLPIRRMLAEAEVLLA